MPNWESAKLRETFGRIVEDKGPFQSLENWNMHKNGSLVLLETSGVPIIDDTGQLRGYRGIGRDITERKRIQEALGLSEEKFSKVFRDSPVSMTLTRRKMGK